MRLDRPYNFPGDHQTVEGLWWWVLIEPYVSLGQTSLVLNRLVWCGLSDTLLFWCIGNASVSRCEGNTSLFMYMGMASRPGINGDLLGSHECFCRYSSMHCMVMWGCMLSWLLNFWPRSSCISNAFAFAFAAEADFFRLSKSSEVSKSAFSTFAYCTVTLE